MPNPRRFAVLIDDADFGQVELHENPTERELVETVMKLPRVAAVLRRTGVSETSFDGHSYNISTKPREGGPVMLAEASRIPGARLVSHPFAGLGIPSAYDARDDR